MPKWVKVRVNPKPLPVSGYILIDATPIVAATVAVWG